MIGSIRKHIQKRGTKIIIWLILLSLAGGSFFSLIRFSRRFGSVDALATVNEYDIGLMEYRRKFISIAHFIQEIRRLYGPQADEALKLWGLSDKPEQAVLENLIQEKALQSSADALGGRVSREYMTNKLKDPLFVRNFLADLVPQQALAGGTLNVEMLRYNLERQGMSEADFEEAVTAAVQRYLLDRLVESSVYVPTSALKELYMRAYAKKKFGIISLSLEEYLKKARTQKLSQEEIATFFNAHKEAYRVPEQRTARLWTFSYDVAVSDKEKEQYYNQHRREFIEKPEELVIQKILLKTTPQTLVEKRKQAQELMKQAKDNPTLFEDLAKKYSDAPEKGAPVAVAQKQLDPALVQAVASLSKGDISPVIDTPQGFVIVKLIERRAASYKPLEKVKGDIEKKLKKEKFASEFSSNAQRVISQASDMPEVFKRFVEEKKAQESMLENSKLTENVQSQKLFGLQKKGDRTFYLEGDKGYIMEFLSSKESFIPGLSTVQEKVVKDIYEQKARALLKEDLDKARNQLKNGIEKAAQAVGGKSETTDWIDPQNQETTKKLEEKKIPINRAMMLVEPQSVIEEILPKEGYLIVLTQIEPFNESDFEHKKGELRAYMASQEVPFVSQSFKEYVRSKAQVKVNEELLRRASSRV